MKWDVAKKNMQFKENVMEGLINDALSHVTEAHWKNYCDHIVKVEQTLWDGDNMHDDIEPLIVQLTSRSSSSTRSSRSSSVETVKIQWREHQCLSLIHI